MSLESIQSHSIQSKTNAINEKNKRKHNRRIARREQIILNNPDLSKATEIIFQRYVSTCVVIVTFYILVKN